MGISIDVTEDNSEEIKRLIEQKIDGALYAIGIQASNYAADKSPVDTGRLRASMTFDKGDKEVAIGTDVEYAIYQEFGTSKFSGHHMLRDAVHNHVDEYVRILTSFLEG